MNLLSVFIITFGFFVTFVYLEEGHEHEEEHGHGHGSLDELIEEISEHLGASKNAENHTVFKFSDIEKFMTDLNFKNCSVNEEGTTCNLCITPIKFLQWYGFNSSSILSEEDFIEILPGFLHVLIPSENSAVCKSLTDRDHFPNKTSELYYAFVNKYGEQTNGSKSLTEEGIEQILDSVNASIGEKLVDKECFSVHDVFSKTDLEDKPINEHNLEHISAFILLKLLDKHCITEEHDHGHGSELPKKVYFINELFEEFGNGTHMTHENFEALVKKLELGSKNSTEEEGEGGHEGHGEHEGHDHRKRRDVSEKQQKQKRLRRAEESHKCYSAENVLDIFSIPEGSTLNKASFQEICPALIQQLESKACKAEANKTTEAETHKDDHESSSSWKPWIGMLVSIFIISVGSLIGVFAAPLSDRKWFPYLIMFLISLAISVLIGDAMLHLLPHALDLHGHNDDDGSGDHSDHDHGEEHDFLKSDSYLWKFVMFLAGCYLFFIFEVCMHAFGNHSHSHDPDSIADLRETHKHAGRTSSLKKHSPNGTLRMSEDHVIKNPNAKRKDSIIVTTPSGITEYKDEKSPTSYDIELQHKKNGYNGFTENTNTVTQKPQLSIKSFKSVVWMILIGDTIHNFMDGVAVGTAFTETWPDGLHGGISTSIAILCHELPHELGDFAVLLNSGLSVKQALLMNFFSSLAAFGGGILGVLLGTTWNASPWIFAITAGLFVYVALADMLPEILHSKLIKTNPWRSISIQTVGMLIGTVIMFVIAAWEEDIKSAFK